MVRQQQVQAITPPPAGVHIGTQAFAVAGTNERHILTWIKDADCDPGVGLLRPGLQQFHEPSPFRPSRSEVAMGTPLTPMQKAERDIEGMRQSIRQMFRDVSHLTLEAHDRAAISRGIQSLQDDLRYGLEKFERGN